jgi:hypothetical protein
MTRRNFDRATKVAIIKRATIDGVIRCERCGIPTRRFEIHHKIADALEINKSRKLMADDGELLCKDAGRESCHGRQTAEHDVPAIAKAKRREARHLGATRPKQSIKNRGFDPVPRAHADREAVKGMSEIARRFLGGAK